MPLSYDEAKTKLIQQILDDPAGFLTEQIKDRQPLANNLLTAFDVEEKPTILRLQEGNDIYLTYHNVRAYPIRRPLLHARWGHEGGQSSILSVPHPKV